MYGPHFSAGFLSRRICFLEDQLASLPHGSIFSRNGVQYVKIKKLNDSTYIEKKLNSKEGQAFAELILKQKQTTDKLRFYKTMYRKYYSGKPIERNPGSEIIKSVPYHMTLEYFNDPPQIINPHKIDTPYKVDDKIVRSRFEVIAIEIINELGLDYKNEIPICTETGTYFMDIVIPVYERNRCVGFEFCGMAEDLKYINSQYPKVMSYLSVGLIPNHDVIFVLGGKTWLPDVDEIKRAIIFGLENC